MPVMERSIEDETDWSADPWEGSMSAPKAKKLKVCNLHKEGFCVKGIKGSMLEVTGIVEGKVKHRESLRGFGRKVYLLRAFNQES